MSNGARFYRCDLHLHTQTDAPRWLGHHDTDEDAAAEAYIRRCYDAGLEIIAITDHNFASKSFIPVLRKAVQRIAKDYNYEIVVLPGFEIAADVGKGLHVLCVFDPDAALDVVDHVLTQCGIAPERFEKGVPLASTMRLPEILEAVQQKKNGRYRGIVICPHSQADAGIFDNDRISEWLQAEEFKNPSLLCLEVPKPIFQMSKGWQLLFRAGDDCDQQWRRSRPVACIMSSDAKALAPEDADNYIGFRHTWIKLGTPTVEGLRHAFLAHESRIRLAEPDLPHTFIADMEVGACRFFTERPFSIALNRQFTAIIGGRGTGKSTLLEYLRWALCDQPVSYEQDDAAGTELPPYAKKRASLIEGTLKNQDADKAYVRVRLVLNNTPHTVTRFAVPDRITLRIGDGDENGVTEADVRRLLPVQAYSQKQLSTVAVRTEELRRLIEAPIRSQVSELNDQIENHRSVMRALYAKVWDAERLDKQITAGEAEAASIKAQIESVKQEIGDLSPEDKETLDDHEKYAAEDQLIQRVQADVAGMGRVIQEARNAVVPLPRDTAVPLVSPEQELLNEVVEIGLRAKKSVEKALQQALEAVSAEAAVLEQKAQAWRTRYAGHVQTYTEAAGRAAAYKRQLSQIEELTHKMNGLQGQLDGLRAQRHAIIIGAGEEANAVAQWIGLHRDRGDMISEACGALSALSQEDVRAVLRRGGDAETAFALLRERLAGGRIRNDWIDRLKSQVTAAPVPAEEWTLLLSEFKSLAGVGSDQADSAELPICPRLTAAGFTAGCLRNVVRQLQPNDWLDLLLTSLEDRPEFYYRVDAGQEILFESASPGQQATALLTILLNQQGGPLIIDQPEEDLDNAIISRVVETIWQAKEHRQLIFASHNANLVVNGDAELVVHCDYTSAENRAAGRVACAGSIDEEHVCEAIKSVMEGGEKAFELRKAKYGF